MIICVTRFDTKTYNENKIYKDKYNITGCIYGSPIKISEKILPDTEILVLEMNNSKNIVEGIGVIKNNILQYGFKLCTVTYKIITYRHEDEELNEVLILFEYYNQIMFYHLLIVFQQILIAVDLEECPPYLEFLI